MKRSPLNDLCNSPWTFFILGLLISVYYFFHPFADLSLIITLKHEGAGYWYRIFSESIFKPQTIYLAESILLPLFAKLIGANASVVSYLILNAFFTILIMPMICIVFRMRIQSLSGVILAILMFSVSYMYLQSYELGFPDPLTIILLSLMVVGSGKWIFVLTFFAALSHFSTSVLAIVAWISLSLATKYTSGKTLETEKYALYGLISGKIFLMLWGYVFNYHLNSRINYVWEQGVGYFLHRYLENPSAFWYTPGKLFLIVNLIIFCFFCFKRKVVVCLAQFFILLISYFSLFITVDGLRVFAVVVVPGYIYLLIVFMNELFGESNRLLLSPNSPAQQ